MNADMQVEASELFQQEMALVDEERRKRARGQFRVAGWVGLLGLGWLGLQLAVVGGNPYIPALMIGTGLVFLVRGLRLR